MDRNDTPPISSAASEPLPAPPRAPAAPAAPAAPPASAAPPVADRAAAPPPAPREAPRRSKSGRAAAKRRAPPPPPPPVDDELEDDEWDDEEELDDDLDDDDTDAEGAADEPAGPRRPWFSWSLLQGTGSVFVSAIIHAALLIALALVALPAETRQTIIETVLAPIREEEEDELEAFELDQQIEAVREVAAAVMSSAPVDVGADGAVGAASSAVEATVAMDQEVLEQADQTYEVKVGDLTMIAPPTSRLIQETPDGALGDPRAIVDDYNEAFDRITQEILLLLDKGPVLCIWAFDQSESMKDDQQEIRQRIDKVYAELGLTTQATAGRLTTAVTSYGQGFLVHTPRPTAELSKIREAIDSVPVDPSGYEHMCQAVGRSVALHRQYAEQSKRQMMLILVTDESGERDDNDRFLEQALAEARSAKCKIYVLGREAVFGYPYAHIRWRHPQTNRIHWLRIDRGPETAFVEQLQIDGFRRRHDAFPSGFGPYEQTRLVRETNGVFFMLPSLESNLVRGEKRRYELEQLKAYRPDLRSRIECLTDRDGAALRRTLWTVINDLNPYNPQVAPHIEMRVHFSPDLLTFAQQARREQQKAIVYLQYLARAEQALEEIKYHREQETSPRWMANYDLMRAQLACYQARIYEYGVALDKFLEKPKIVPARKAPNLTHTHWDIYVRRELFAAEKSQPYIDRADELFQVVIDEHPGTPWAARAANEKQRGYGVWLSEQYEPPYLNPSGPVMPIPKL